MVNCAIKLCRNNTGSRTTKLLGISFLWIQIIVNNANHLPQRERKFPNSFIFGASTSAFQIEGAWDEDGKSPSIWDEMTHFDNSSLVDDHSNADVAADSYHLYKRDVEIMKEIGLDFYRFSISWARLLPNGFANYVNPAGVEYYNNLIDEMIRNNVKPMAVIYHWDLPVNLQKLGGFVNPRVIEWFVQFAKVCFDNFGDRVKLWITLNKPRQICIEGYGNGIKPPMIHMSGIADYMCIKNVLLAHANVYHLYKEQYSKFQNGKIGIGVSCMWYQPWSGIDSDHNAQVADDMNQFDWGQYLHPIFSRRGDFPDVVKSRVAYKSAKQGFAKSRLPSLTPDEIKLLKGSSDFLAINSYTTKMAKHYTEGQYPIPSYLDDTEAETGNDPTWPKSSLYWLQEVPSGLYEILMAIREQYNNPPVFITENGWATTGGLIDDDRIRYINKHLDKVVDALDRGCEVKGYSVWSLIDTYEFRGGYRPKFGLYEVNFTSPERVRTPRKSAVFYRDVITKRAIIANCYSYVMTDKGLICAESQARKFPVKFQFGAATSAYQVEGGWDRDGKSPSIWDVMTHNQDISIEDESNGDISSDAYHRYKRDVELIKDLGLSFYLFSLSWTRILPMGFSNKINHRGLEYYNNLIDELLAHDITPMVTLYHWDLPYELQNLGGFANPNIAEWFEGYAKVAFESFGNRVKNWMTFNNPKEICQGGYGSNSKAPMVNMSGIADYMCTDHLLHAHAQVYRLYDRVFRPTQKGVVGISIDCTWFEPATESVDDVRAANDAKQFDWEQYVNPIFSPQGNYPMEMRMKIAVKSTSQKFPTSRQPKLQTTLRLLGDSSDFFGLSSFTTKLASSAPDGTYPSPSYMDDMGAILKSDMSWPQSQSSWLQEVPSGFYKLLKYIREKYDNPPIYITANGWSTTTGLQDDDRVRYHRNYLNAMLDAMDEGSNIMGYAVWSLMDGFEWTDGYTKRFGLYEVDFTTPERTRIPRKSAFVYKQIVNSGQLDMDFQPPEFDNYV